MEQPIQTLNIAAATLLVQLFFLAMLSAGVYLSRLGTNAVYRAGSMEFSPPGLSHAPTLLGALVSFAVLLVSEELYAIWSPLFPGFGINTMSAVTAIAIVFALNFALVGFLMVSTGGSNQSPFTPALLTLPALAIFLRLPPFVFVAAAVISGVLYLVLFSRTGRDAKIPAIATAFINLACLALSIFTGYITRPVPITELGSAFSP